MLNRPAEICRSTNLAYFRIVLVFDLRSLVLVIALQDPLFHTIYDRQRPGCSPMRYKVRLGEHVRARSTKFQSLPRMVQVDGVRVSREKVCMPSFVLRLVSRLSTAPSRFLTPDWIVESGRRKELCYHRALSRLEGRIETETRLRDIADAVDTIEGWDATFVHDGLVRRRLSEFSLFLESLKDLLGYK